MLILGLFADWDFMECFGLELRLFLNLFLSPLMSCSYVRARVCVCTCMCVCVCVCVHIIKAISISFKMAFDCGFY